ncbi:MAG TPA: DUF2000 domain-containing protein [Actinophytocola sp.]|uniref:DUF2000 domain-containing protein n=1 Tax=Actinophytocola sp. TaxID=1872138 RepID=UPI002DB791C7|nr:DUF2000 domain-containing protein [Actinophytocola sp.]HEU5475275.1 DUF2000 domain-containing protein [Actinophytocola sp.]
MRFPTKIVVAIRGDLETWRKLNITAFLAGAVAGGVPEVLGKPYEDGSANRYLAMFRQPVVVYVADGVDLRRVRQRAVARDLPTAVFTEEILGTDNDDDNRAAVRAVGADALNLVGVALYGPRNAVDKVCKGLALHS